MPRAAGTNLEATRLAGPLFWWEALRQSRRRRGHFARTLYAAALLAWLWFVLGWGDLTQRNVTQLTEISVNGYLAVQYVTVVLLTPMFVVSSIVEDRQRRTYDLLLTTHLSAREILLDKMLSRVVHVVAVLAAGLPVLSLLQVLGGVNIGTVLLHSAAALLLMAAVASYSVRAATVCETVPAGVGVCWAIFHAASAPIILIALIVSATWSFQAATLTFAALHLVPAMMTLNRAVHIMEHREPTIVQQERLPPVSRLVASRVHEAVGRDCHRTPELAADRVRIQHSVRQPVSERPILWKEMFFPLPDFGCIVAMTFVTISVMLPLGMLDFALSQRETHSGLVHLAVGATVPAVLIAVCLRTAGTFGEERLRGTLDDLRVLPLTAVELVRDRWLGCIARYWAFVGLMVLALGVGAIWRGGYFLAAAPLLLLQCAVYSLLGLRLSLSWLNPLQARVVMVVILIVTNLMLPLWGRTLMTLLPPPAFAAVSMAIPWLTLHEVWLLDGAPVHDTFEASTLLVAWWPAYAVMLPILAGMGAALFWGCVRVVRRG